MRDSGHLCAVANAMCIFIVYAYRRSGSGGRKPIDRYPR